jgi:hypothetical protein
MIARALVIGYLANSPRGGDLFLFILQRRVGIIECAFFGVLGAFTRYRSRCKGIWRLDRGLGIDG